MQNKIRPHAIFRSSKELQRYFFLKVISKEGEKNNIKTKQKLPKPRLEGYFRLHWLNNKEFSIKIYIVKY